jgi:uncharacterized protein YbjT (DUF2867 family)
MKIVVFGANGGVGRRVAEQLLAAGHSVTAVVRDASRLAVQDPDIRVVEIADLQDPLNLVPALRGADAVVSGVGPHSTKDGPIASRVTASILAAMQKAGVRRLVTVSAAPVGPVPHDESLFGRLILQPLARIFLRPVFEDLGRMETDMRASGLDWTAVRPPRLTDGPLTGQYRARIGESVPRGYLISRADTAHAICAALANAATFGQPVGVAY